MATVDQIEQVILRVAGNPVAGPFRELAHDMALEIAALDATTKSMRVLDKRETR